MKPACNNEYRENNKRNPSETRLETVSNPFGTLVWDPSGTRLEPGWHPPGNHLNHAQQKENTFGTCLEPVVWNPS